MSTIIHEVLAVSLQWYIFLLSRCALIVSDSSTMCLFDSSVMRPPIFIIGSIFLHIEFSTVCGASMWRGRKINIEVPAAGIYEVTNRSLLYNAKYSFTAVSLYWHLSITIYSLLTEYCPSLWQAAPVGPFVEYCSYLQLRSYPYDSYGCAWVATNQTWLLPRK